MKICVFALACCLCVPVFAIADDEGHHHEELTEAQLGTVHFPSSCLAAQQKQVERGVAMLHSFWYEESEKEFQQIEKDDPQCAIARWGVAMSLWHQLWNHPDKPKAQARTRWGGAEAGAFALRDSARERLHCCAEYVLCAPGKGISETGDGVLKRNGEAPPAKPRRP